MDAGPSRPWGGGDDDDDDDIEMVEEEAEPEVLGTFARFSQIGLSSLSSELPSLIASTSPSSPDLGDDVADQDDEVRRADRAESGDDAGPSKKRRRKDHEYLTSLEQVRAIMQKLMDAKKIEVADHVFT